MLPIEENIRIPEIERLGLSSPLVQLASGKSRTRLFAGCVEPYMVYHGIQWTGDPIFVPLWERFDTVTAVQERDGKLEFFAFSVESPSSPWTLARSEQGLLATLFFGPLNEWYEDTDEFRQQIEEEAAGFGFQYVRQADSILEAHASRGYDEKEAAYARFVQEIDAEEGLRRHS
jgi:hypothetical protein